MKYKVTKVGPIAQNLSGALDLSVTLNFETDQGKLELVLSRNAASDLRDAFKHNRDLLRPSDDGKCDSSST